MGEGTRKSLIVAAVSALALSIGVGAGLLGRGPPPTTAAVPAVAPAVDSMIDVHVVGWVIAPGVVSVRQGSIVADAIEAAGGLRAGAAVEAVNLAAEVVAGQQIIVPEAGPAGGGPVGGADGLIQLNSASPSQLEELPGVGPVLAERIVTYRDDNGPFQTVEDLLQVPGIGEAKLASIRDLVRP